MSSIIGQAMETGASGGSGAGGSFGSILGSLGSSVGSLFSGGGFGTPTSTIPAVENLGAGVSSAPGTDPNAPSPYGVPGVAAAGDPGAAFGAVGSPSGMTVGTPEAFSSGGVNAPPPVTGMGGAAPGSTFTPNAPQAPDPTFLQELENFLGIGGGGAGGAGGGAGSKGMGLGGWINLGGGLLEALNKFLVQRTLQNPSQLASAANKLARPLGRQARERIMGPVTAAAQETSGVNAPLLYAQALAQVLAPYQYQNEQNALREEIAALTASEGGAFTTPSLFGGSSGSTAYG